MVAVLTTFEAAQTIFAWLHEAPWQFGYSLVSFSEMMNAIRLTADIEALSFEAQLGPATNHSSSLAPTWQISLAREAFNAVFFVTTIIMLMNVLIAMMTNTLSTVIELAEEEWRLVFAGMVREYFDSTVLPPPFNVIELVANRCMRSKMAVRGTLYEEGKLRSTWGQHYLWPVPSLRFHLPMAMQAYKAASKDVGRQGTKSIIRKLDKTLQTQAIAVSVGANAAQPTPGATERRSSVDLRAIRTELQRGLEPRRADRDSINTALAALRSDVEGLKGALTGSRSSNVADGDNSWISDLEKEVGAANETWNK